MVGHGWCIKGKGNMEQEALEGAGNERSGWKKKLREGSLTAFENALWKPSTVEAF